MKHKTKWIIMLCIFAMSMVFCATISYAYFSTRPFVYTDENGTKQTAKLGMEISLLFDKLNPSTVEAGTDLNISTATVSGVEFDSEATWGTAQNPYIISDVRHLYNLSALQSIGYFKTVFGGKLASSTPTEETLAVADVDDGTKIPYFLICNADGEPVKIDGSTMTIAPIGNDTNPFIGYIGGAFKEGTISVNGKACDVSAIDQVTVRSNTDVVDVGLLGHIGYIGKESTTDGEAFNAITTTIRNLLISDVKVIVENPTPWEVISDTLHRFTYSLLSDTDKDKIAHENHHVGIFGGHAEYATIEYISVYYSGDNIKAIDINHTAKSTNNTSANYNSSSGILGYLYNINPDIVDGKIASGTGTGNADLAISSGGAGTGGGALSGMGRGYLYASALYEKYAVTGSGNSIQPTRDQGQILWQYYKTENSGSLTYGPMVTKMPNGSYRLQNATTTTESISITNGTLTIGTNTWTEFILQVVVSATTDNPPVYTYKYYDGPTYTATSPELYSFEEVKMTIFNAKSIENGDDLCIEWVRPRLIGAFPDDHTGKYYFYDGVFTFALSSTSDVIEDTWKNNTADTFYIGDDIDGNWQVNTNISDAVAMYTKLITNNEELDSAISNGKKLFITFDIPDSNPSSTTNDVFAMTLQDQSTAGSGTPDEKYSTPGKTLTFDTTLSDDLKYAYENGAITRLPDGISGSVEDLLDNWDDYSIINVGDLSQAPSLGTIKQRYQVTAQQQDDKVYMYRNTDGSDDTAAVVTNGTVQENYVFNEENGYDGYIYYETTQHKFIVTVTGYTWYYCKKDGSIEKISNDSSMGTPNAPSDYLNNTGSDQGETIYSITYGGTTYKGVVVNVENSTIYRSSGTQTPCSINSSNGTVSKVVGNAHPIIIYENGMSDNVYLRSVSSSNVVTAVEPTGTSSVSGNSIYRAQVNGTWTNDCMVVNMYSTYNLGYAESGDTITKYLNLLYMNYIDRFSRNVGHYYALWNGNDSALDNTSDFSYGFGGLSGTVSPSITKSKISTIVFKHDGSGDCYIGYSMGAQTRYVSYSSSQFVSSTAYNWDNSTSPYTTFRIYTVEGTQAIGGTRVRFVPKSESSVKETLSCDQYVLVPETTTTGSVVFNGSTQQANPTTTFSVFNIDDLGWEHGENGDTQVIWKNAEGQKLSYSDLHNKFTLATGMEFGVNINIGGGTWDIGGDTMLRAPVGSNGEEANIPLGGIAFRINREGSNKIRVIVAVPTTSFYPNEDIGTNPSTPNLNYTNEYYFGLWHYDEAGASTVQTFNKSDASVLFNMPRSHTYASGSNASASEYIKVHYDANRNGFIDDSESTSLRSYLNGSRVLIAYEFTVTEAGIYLLGSANSPMEIVYFSSDGTASAGRDGTGGSRVGSIDFVYDYNNEIIVVQDYATAPPADEDYTRYYASLCLLYTYNTKNANGDDIPLNDFEVKVRRQIINDHSTLVITVTSKADNSQTTYILCARYGSQGDTVNLTNSSS